MHWHWIYSVMIYPRGWKLTIGQFKPQWPNLWVSSLLVAPLPSRSPAHTSLPSGLEVGGGGGSGCGGGSGVVVVGVVVVVVVVVVH